MKKTVVLTVLSLALILGNIGTKTAHARSLTISQALTMKHNMTVSLHTVNWYHNAGQWTLHLKFNECSAVAKRYSQKRANICYRSRLDLQHHAERYAKIKEILYPTPKMFLSDGGYNWDSMVINCEAHGVPNPWYANTGNGFFFGPQFTIQTWHANGGGEVREMNGVGPSMLSYSIAYIKHVAYNVMKSQGSGAWPNCNGYLLGGI